MIDTIDTTRQERFVDRRMLSRQSVHIIGAGALGSTVALLLVKCGLERLHVWDDDVVAPHNLANQLYLPGQVGQSKVTSLAETLSVYGCDVQPHPSRVAGETVALSVADATTLFVCVDSMQARKDIIERACLTVPTLRHVLEARIGEDLILAYCFKPSQMLEWRETWYPDATIPGCEAMLGTHAFMAASLLVWLWVRALAGDTDVNEVGQTLRPITQFVRAFPSAGLSAGLPAQPEAAPVEVPIVEELEPEPECW